MSKQKDTLGALQAAASDNDSDKGAYGGVAPTDFFQNVSDDEKALAEAKAKLEEKEAELEDKKVELERLEAEATAIIKSGTGEMFIRGQRATAAGLEIADDIKFEDMQVLGELLFKMNGRIQLFIGDMLIKSEKLNYGSIDEIAQHFRFEAKTLYNWASLCEAVPVSLRREVLDSCPETPLTKSHYELVQKFHEYPDLQRKYLLQAATEGLSVSAFRARIQGGDEVEKTTDEEPLPLADKAYRKRLMRVWRLVSSNQLDKIKDDDILLIRGWLVEIEKKRK